MLTHPKHLYLKIIKSKFSRTHFFLQGICAVGKPTRKLDEEDKSKRSRSRSLDENPSKANKTPKLDSPAPSSKEKNVVQSCEGGDSVGSVSTTGDGRRQRARLQKLNQQIAHFGQLKRLKDAIAAFRRISAEGLEPSAHSYASLINAHVRSGDVEGPVSLTVTPKTRHARADLQHLPSPFESFPRFSKSGDWPPLTPSRGRQARSPLCRRWRPMGSHRASWPTPPCSRSPPPPRGHIARRI